MILISSLTRACKLINDTVYHRLPIHLKLLEVILFEIERVFRGKEYLSILYKTIFCIGYYGLFRVSELAKQQSPAISDHAIKAANVHVGVNKDKLLFVLYSSKTHDKESPPQKIKIEANSSTQCSRGRHSNRHFCPFRLMRQFMRLRGTYKDCKEQLFIFNDKIPVQPIHIRKVLSTCLSNLGLDSSLYGTHSLRIGRTGDMVRAGYSIEEVKRLGRWKSNAIFRYIK